MEPVYYWEHKNDESRYLRESDAEIIARVAHAQPAESEIGVIVSPSNHGPLEVQSVPLGESIAETAKALASAHLAIQAATKATGMQSITMTAEQTAVYDGDDDRSVRELMTALTARAQTLANESEGTVEIYTADGIVADARSPDRGALQSRGPMP